MRPILITLFVLAFPGHSGPPTGPVLSAGPCNPQVEVCL